VVGIALIVYSLMMAFVLMSIGWGGFVDQPLVVRLIGFGTVATVLLAGVTATSYGSCQWIRSHSRTS
jgi:hypothetical protein